MTLRRRHERDHRLKLLQGPPLGCGEWATTVSAIPHPWTSSCLIHGSSLHARQRRWSVGSGTHRGWRGSPSPEVTRGGGCGSVVGGRVLLTDLEGGAGLQSVVHGR